MKDSSGVEVVDVGVLKGIGAEDEIVTRDRSDTALPVGGVLPQVVRSKACPRPDGRCQSHFEMFKLQPLTGRVAGANPGGERSEREPLDPFPPAGREHSAKSFLRSKNKDY